MGLGLMLVGVASLFLLGWIAFLIDKQTGVVQEIVTSLRMGM